MNTEYKLAREQVLDSMLFELYIEPVLSDTMVFSVEINDSAMSSEFVHMKEPHNVFKKYDVLVDSANSVSLHTEGNIKVIQHIEVEDSPVQKEFLWKDNDMLLRSFKMVMSKTSDKTGTDSIVMIRIEDESMDSLLLSTFTEFITEKGYNFTSEWTDDSLVLHHNRFNSIDIPKDFRQTSTTLSVTGINPYLLRKILPQLFFILFLVGLTATAFRLTYRTMKKQTELNILRKDFISNMTHELKTPVATMKVALEALDIYKVGQDPEKAKEYMDIANGEINRLDNLIGRILDHVILEEDGSALKAQKIDLNVILSECIEMMRPGIAKKQATVIFQKTEEALVIQGDSWYIKSAIINIIDNSLKYGGAKPEIRIGLESVPGLIRIIIQDNGPGISEGNEEKIFDKFFRIPTGDQHNVKGHGLGLSLAALIMKMHEGSIIHQRPKEGGCRMILEFPHPKNED